MIRAGDLDRRVTILRATSADDGFASTPGAHGEVGERWAKKTDASDAERVSAAAQGARISARFLMRWDPLTSTIGGTDRLACEGVTYEVTGSKEVGRRREGIEITAAVAR